MIKIICPACGAFCQIQRTKKDGFQKLSGCLHVWAADNRYGFQPEPTAAELSALANVINPNTRNDLRGAGARYETGTGWVYHGVLLGRSIESAMAKLDIILDRQRGKVV